MGADLGELFCALWNEYMRLRMTWVEFRHFFGTSPERVELLNAAASMSFRIIHDRLWESTLLHLCRLTDPPEMGGADRANLTLRQLPALVDPHIHSATEDLVTKAVASTGFARDLRNRRIAHADLALALQRPARPLAPASRKQVEDALQVMADLLNLVEGHYRKTEVPYDAYSSNERGAVDLLYVIRDGLEAREVQKRRLKEGTASPDDYGPPRPL